MFKFSKKYFPWRIFYRVALIQGSLVILAILISGISARQFFKRYFVNEVSKQIQSSLVLMSKTLNPQIDEGWCRQQVTDTKLHLTVLNQSGQVVCDSLYAASDVLGLTKEPEIQNALKRKDGLPYFWKLEGETLNVALSVPSASAILRASFPVDGMTTAVAVYDASLGAFLALIALALVLLAIYLARQMVFPLGRLLVKTQLLAANQGGVGREDWSEDSFGEWSDLESHIDSLKKNLDRTVQSLSTEQVELDTLMSAISDAVLAVDLEGLPMFFNSRFELSFGGYGFNRQTRFWEIFRDPEILDAFRGALNEGKRGSTRAIPFDGERGLKRYFTLAVSPLMRQGQIYGALGIFHDVTELKSAEQMRIDFVANVSHELRTPLTAIKGYTETLMADTQADPERYKGTSVTDFLNIISRNTARLMNLMGDLLDLSSIESSQILQKETLRTTELTQRVIKNLEVKFANKGQEISTTFEATTLTADSNRVEQVLVNLLDNAHKYTPEGGKVFVTWEKGQRTIRLKVKDTGPGIPLEHQPRLFERFYRIDKARSREQGGTGLGLAIVKHILQRHEGVVWVESTPGHGATFICEFPE